MFEICYHCKAQDGLHPHEESCLENYAADEPAERDYYAEELALENRRYNHDRN